MSDFSGLLDLLPIAGSGTIGTLGIWVMWNWRKDQVYQREIDEKRRLEESGRAQAERDRLAGAVEKLDKERKSLDGEIRGKLFAMIEKSVAVIETNTQSLKRHTDLMEICENKSGAWTNGRS